MGHNYFWLARRLLVALAIVVYATASDGAAPITVKHERGEVTLPDVPRKVVTFDLSALDTLDTLGVPVAGVPNFAMPAYLSRYTDKSYARIGTLFEPDYEAVSALEPDLIIVGPRSRPKYGELARIAPTIDLTGDAAHPYASDLRNIATLGRIFGKDKEAAALIDKLDVSVARLREKAATAGKGLVLLVTGGRISAYGPGSRFGILHDVFGVMPAASDIKAGVHGQPVSFEFIQKVNPDWLFVLDRDAAIGQQRDGKAAAALLDNEVVGQTTAWKKKQVVYLDPAAWYLAGGGARSLQSAVNQLTQAFARTQ